MQNCTESEQEQKRQAKLARASTRMREAKTKLTSEEIEQIVDRLLTLDDAQAILALPSKNWFYQKIFAGTLPFPYVRVGAYIRIPAKGLRKYIESQTNHGSGAA